MISEKSHGEELTSKLGAHSILGCACLVLGSMDLLAWADIISPDSGWVTRISGVDWLQPLLGLAIIVIGSLLAGSDCLQAFAGRDEERKKARRSAMIAAVIAGAALVFTLETLVPARDV